VKFRAIRVSFRTPGNRHSPVTRRPSNFLFLYVLIFLIWFYFLKSVKIVSRAALKCVADVFRAFADGFAGVASEFRLRFHLEAVSVGRN